MDLSKRFLPQGTPRRVESGRLRTPDGKRVFYALRGHSEQIKPIGMRTFSMFIKGEADSNRSAIWYKQSTDFHLLHPLRLVSTIIIIRDGSNSPPS